MLTFDFIVTFTYQIDFVEYQKVLPLQNSMKNPKDFGGWNGVLNQSMTVVLLSYITIGFFGYLKYGEQAKGSITLNLPLGNPNM